MKRYSRNEDPYRKLAFSTTCTKAETRYRKRMESKTKLGLLLANLGPFLVFYVANHFWGLRPAVATTIVFTLVEIVWKRPNGQASNQFFKFVAAITITFGLFDMVAEESFLFKYEACATNILTAAFFASTLFSKKSIIQEFYEQRANARPWTSSLARYFKWLTLVWVFYFLVKAAIYLQMANAYSIEQELTVRGILGWASFALMLGVSIYGSKKLYPWLLQRGWLGSN